MEDFKFGSFQYLPNNTSMYESTENYKNNINNMKYKNKHRKFKVYNNGHKNIHVYEGDEVPDGFVIGSLYKFNRLNINTINNFILHAVGKHWYTNGVDDIRAFECPEGYWPGRTNGVNMNLDSTGLKWFHKGTFELTAYECPKGFEPGRNPNRRYIKKNAKKHCSKKRKELSRKYHRLKKLENSKTTE